MLFRVLTINFHASGNSAEFGEIGKHTKNDQMCGRLGWTCIPLVFEVYGGWDVKPKDASLD